ncbi:hypothetical protein GOP47_0010830, partial [Adiantum capillus-veneris]
SSPDLPKSRRLPPPPCVPRRLSIFTCRTLLDCCNSCSSLAALSAPARLPAHCPPWIFSALICRPHQDSPAQLTLAPRARQLRPLLQMPLLLFSSGWPLGNFSPHCLRLAAGNSCSSPQGGSPAPLNLLQFPPQRPRLITRLLDLVFFFVSAAFDAFLIITTLTVRYSPNLAA